MTQAQAKRTERADVEEHTDEAPKKRTAEQEELIEKSDELIDELDELLDELIEDYEEEVAANQRVAIQWVVVGPCNC